MDKDNIKCFNNNNKNKKKHQTCTVYRRRLNKKDKQAGNVNVCMHLDSERNTLPTNNSLTSMYAF